MIMLFIWFFGIINLAHTFAAVLGPTAINVTISGDSYVGKILTASYTYKDNPWKIQGTAGFSDGALNYFPIPLSIYNNVPYVAYQDSTRNNKITVMKLDGTYWTPVGSAWFSDGASFYQSLTIFNGIPYVAYRDDANSYKVTVMKYSGSSWEVVGTKGFSDATAFYTKIAIDGNGTPYVAYLDWSLNNKVTVMKYNGSSWEVVWTKWFSDGQWDFLSFTIDNNIPYVAYSDYSYETKATVMKYNGSNRVSVGNKGFSAGQANNTSISVYNGTPYIAYRDVANSYKATVMKYNGSNRETVGSAGFSDGWADYTSLVVDNGTPYIAYMDYNNSYKATVMKYNGSNREVVGGKAFSDGVSRYTSLAIYNNTPYVAFRDDAHNSKATVMKLTTSEPEGTSLYQRYSNGQEIQWVTGLTYTTTINDLWLPVSFNVTPVSQWWIHWDLVRSDNSITIVSPSATNIAITWVPIIWTVLTWSYTYSYPDPEWVSLYQWYSNGQEIQWATGLIYIITSADQGKTITFSVKPFSVSWIPWSQVWSPGLQITPPIATEVNITGDTTIGSTLSVSYHYSYIVSDPEGIPLYQWYRNGIMITGATRSIYTLVLTDANKLVSCGVTPVSQSGERGSESISNEVLVASPLIWATGVNIAGIANVGEIVTGNYTYYTTSIRKAVGNRWFSSSSTTDIVMTIDRDGIPYVAYQDANNGNRLTIMKYIDTWREIVGIPDFTQGAAMNISLVVYEGTPYVGFRDEAYSSKATVMKFNGDSRELVGSQWFSDNITFYNKLIIDKSGSLYMAYNDWAFDNKATVMKYNGIDWEPIGVKGFTDGRIGYISLAADESGNIYIAYNDRLNANKATVMKHNGSERSIVGMSWFSMADVRDISLVTGSGGIIYVQYAAWEDWYKTTVMKYTGDDWEPVWVVGLSDQEVYSSSVFVYSGIPYVAYIDAANGYKVTVMKYNGSDWESVGIKGISNTHTNYLSFSFYNGTPYIAYQDSSIHNGVTVMRFSDDPEWMSRYQWYRDWSIIVGATGKSYTLTDTDLGKNIIFEITPISLSTLQGISVQSSGIVVGAASWVIDNTASSNNGGWPVFSQDQCPSIKCWDASLSYYDNVCGKCIADVSLPKDKNVLSAHTSAKIGNISWSKYSDELNQSYLWAYGLDITTIPTIQTANILWTITREQIAKMVVNYANKVLSTPLSTWNSCTFNDMINTTTEMKYYARVACYLGIMGLKPDGTSDNVFNPKQEVTRDNIIKIALWRHI